ncbi:MAG: hypothetical protein AMJ69_04630 [Gammaproteobacteria bacterium SG8_47]|nr:MAG: hypothetical protein AMJ69_04630 [Gammaproteobacteria bacterium SG8_47]
MDALCLLFQAQYQRFHDISALGQLAKERRAWLREQFQGMTATDVRLGIGHVGWASAVIVLFTAR